MWKLFFFSIYFAFSLSDEKWSQKVERSEERIKQGHQADTSQQLASYTNIACTYSQASCRNRDETACLASLQNCRVISSSSFFSFSSSPVSTSSSRFVFGLKQSNQLRAAQKKKRKKKKKKKEREKREMRVKIYYTTATTAADIIILIVNTT